jgi:uncharacterized membrane protein YecN with MAPEG domain
MSSAHSPIALWSLIGYVLWTMLLVVFILLHRLGMMMRGERKLNEFPGGQPHGSDAYWRANRAHLNAVENLPLVIAVFALFYALARPTPLWAWLPAVALGGRVLQSLAHLASGSAPAVAVRFTGLVVQYVCLVAMVVIVVRVLPLP